MPREHTHAAPAPSPSIRKLLLCHCVLGIPCVAGLVQLRRGGGTDSSLPHPHVIVGRTGRDEPKAPFLLGEPRSKGVVEARVCRVEWDRGVRGGGRKGILIKGREKRGHELAAPKPSKTL